jgi:hypothetical protein
MHRTLTALGMSALLMAGVASTAAGQARGYVGFGAGVSLPMGDFKDGAKTGWLGQVIAGVTSASGVIGGRVDGMYARHSIKSGSTSGGTVKLMGANLDLVWTPGHRPNKVHPYLLGGIGFYNAKFGNADGDTNLAFNVGGGVQVHLGNRMDFYTELRYLNIRTDNSIGLLPISIGLRWGGI